MAFLPVPKNGRDVGECIYCGSVVSPLQREHAVPYRVERDVDFAEGKLCRMRGNGTHRFERDTLKGLWPALRCGSLSMQSRHRSRPRITPACYRSGRIGEDSRSSAGSIPTLPADANFPGAWIRDRTAVDQRQQHETADFFT